MSMSYNRICGSAARTCTTLIASLLLAACGEASVLTADGPAASGPRPPASAPAPSPDGVTAPDGPRDAARPEARPGPTDEDGRRAAGGDYRRQEILDIAKRQPAVAHADGALIGDVPGPLFVVLGWGDVLNYQATRRVVDDDRVVIRVIKRAGTGQKRTFYMVSIDPDTLAVLDNVALTESPATDDYGDVAATPWRD